MIRWVGLFIIGLFALSAVWGQVATETDSAITDDDAVVAQVQTDTTTAESEYDEEEEDDEPDCD